MPDVDTSDEQQKKPRKRRRPKLDRSTLGVIVLLVLAGAGLYYMDWRTRAGVELLASADADAASISSLLAGGQQSLVTLSKSIQSTRDVVDRINRRDEARLASAKPIEQDPFAFAKLDAVGADRPANLSASSRDDAHAKALAAARLLQLQSIMFGSTRRSCLIDGKLYFESQTCGTFTIDRISQDAVIIRTGEFKFDLRLRR